MRILRPNIQGSYFPLNEAAIRMYLKMHLLLLLFLLLLFIAICLLLLLLMMDKCGHRMLICLRRSKWRSFCFHFHPCLFVCNVCSQTNIASDIESPAAIYYAISWSQDNRKQAKHATKNVASEIHKATKQQQNGDLSKSNSSVRFKHNKNNIIWLHDQNKSDLLLD